MAMVYMGGHVSGAHYNPAVSLAVFLRGKIGATTFNPAVGFGAKLGAALYAGGPWSDLRLYIVGPLLGAAVGAGINGFQIRGSELALEPPEGRPSPGAPAPVPEGSDTTR